MLIDPIKETKTQPHGLAEHSLRNATETEVYLMLQSYYLPNAAGMWQAIGMACPSPQVSRGMEGSRQATVSQARERRWEGGGTEW